jgi:hypothetical protein
VPGAQTPAWQVSTPLQALPSPQPVPSATGGFEHAPDAGSHVPALWQASEALHAMGAPDVQAPAWQVSFCVHALPSSQTVPFGAETTAHWPVAGSHAPAKWHASAGEHVATLAGLQTPAEHVSPIVQRFPSSQAWPSGAAGLEQTPVAGSQVPAAWQASEALQTTLAQRSIPPVLDELLAVEVELVTLAPPWPPAPPLPVEDEEEDDDAVELLVLELLALELLALELLAVEPPTLELLAFEVLALEELSLADPPPPMLDPPPPALEDELVEVEDPDDDEPPTPVLLEDVAPVVAPEPPVPSPMPPEQPAVGSARNKPSSRRSDRRISRS